MVSSCHVRSRERERRDLPARSTRLSKPNSSANAARARERAARHFFDALERASTLDDAWRFVLSGPKAPAVGAELYQRLSQFLKHLEAPPAASKREREAYVALIQRFLKTQALERSIAVRMALREVERAD